MSIREQLGIVPCLALVMLLILTISPAGAAPFLSIDFQNSGNNNIAPATQLGFSPFTQADGAAAGGKVFATSEGNITLKVLDEEDVTLGGYFNRGGVSDAGPLTYANLYNDFVFDNGGAGGGNTVPKQIDFEFSGLAASTAYEVTWFSYDDNNDGGHLTSFSGIAGSNGFTSLTWASQVDPTTNYDPDNATTTLFETNASGVLTVRATDASNLRVNGVQVSLKPTGSVAVGPGSATTNEFNDNAGASVTIVDQFNSEALVAGQYKATSFNYDAGQAGAVTPFLAILTGTDTYQVIAVGAPQVIAAAAQDQVVAFGGSDTFSLGALTTIYAGFDTISTNPIPFDDGVASTDLQTPRIGGARTVGETFAVTSNANLVRIYAFSVNVVQVPEPSTLLMGAFGLAVVGGARARRRRER